MTFVLKLILLLLVSTDTWQTTKCVRVQRLREGLQNGGHRDPLVRSWSNIWCCCSLSKVVVLSRITTNNCSTVLLLVPTAYLTFLQIVMQLFWRRLLPIGSTRCTLYTTNTSKSSTPTSVICWQLLPPTLAASTVVYLTNLSSYHHQFITPIRTLQGVCTSPSYWRWGTMSEVLLKN